MSSLETKSSKKKYFIVKFMSFLCTLAPLLTYIVIGFADGSIHKEQKIFLGMTVIVAIALVLVNILMKYHLRSPLFMLLLGLYYALDNILILIIIVCIGTILDEFILQPLVKKYRNKTNVNKEIDLRFGE